LLEDGCFWERTKGVVIGRELSLRKSTVGVLEGIVMFEIHTRSCSWEKIVISERRKEQQLRENSDK
jgi:hypothetical protein